LTSCCIVFSEITAQPKRGAPMAEAACVTGWRRRGSGRDAWTVQKRRFGLARQKTPSSTKQRETQKAACVRVKTM
jgi:hypothetical protein